MTSSAVEEDIDLYSLIDFDADFNCIGVTTDNLNYSSCPNPAEYIIWFDPCHCREVAVCNEHLKGQIEFVTVHVNTVFGLQCNDCGGNVSSVGSRPI